MSKGGRAKNGGYKGGKGGTIGTQRDLTAKNLPEAAERPRQHTKTGEAAEGLKSDKSVSKNGHLNREMRVISSAEHRARRNAFDRTASNNKNGREGVYRGRGGDPKLCREKTQKNL